MRRNEGFQMEADGDEIAALFSVVTGGGGNAV
jgi:hypothetical protein